MEEVKKFIQLLWRYRLVVIIVPLITVMITYFLVRKMPSVYGAPTQIATGIVDETQQMAFSEASLLQDSRVTQKFVNLIETMKSKALLDQVSYKLILHDLTSGQPLRDTSVLYKGGLNESAIAHAIEVYTQKLRDKEALDLMDDDQKGLAIVLGWMGYDSESIKYNLNIFRIGESDFIYMDFESENANLSAFVVNTLTNVFIDDYKLLVRENQRASVEFLENLIRTKALALARKDSILGAYKIRHRILDLTQQSSQLLSSVATYEAQKQEAEKNIASLQGTINNIDKQFDPKDRRYAEAAMSGPHQELVTLREEINALNQKYLESDWDEQYRAPRDSLQRVANELMLKLSDKIIVNPQSTAQTLVLEKLNRQLQLDMEFYSLNSINKRINEINNKFTELVPHEAVISALTRDIAIVQKEYQDATAQYNQISMESEYPVKLRQVQPAMPGGEKPSKKMLLVILSGIVSGAFCIMVFFVVFFFDNKIRNPMDLAIATKFPVLGYLNLVGRSTLDLKGIWKNLHGTPEMVEFKRQLRSTRFEVNKELTKTSDTGRILSITSMSEGEGKTLLSACIAYTYVMINKKVLLIDGNFDNPSITKNSNTHLFIEDYFKTGEIEGIDFNSGIMVMGNYGGDKSLLEVSDEKNIREGFNKLRFQFDVVIIETPALISLNKAKEWIAFSDKTVSVFEANQSLNETKKQQLHYLASINGKFIGWILNKVRPDGRTPERIDRATVLE